MKSGWVRFAGIAGVLIFLFGILGAFVVDFRGAAAILPGAHLVIGLALIAAWFAGYGFANWKGAGEIIRGRTVRFGANAVLYGVVFTAILAAVNFLAQRHDRRWDLTEQGVYSIAEQSKNVVANLKAPLKMVVFKVANGPDPERIKDLLNLYKNSGSRFTYEVVDPQAKPHLVEKYGMKTGNYIYIEYGDGDPKAISRINEFTEDALTNAILKLSRGQEKKIYYVQGHGEGDLKSGKPGGFEQFASAVTDEHLAIEPLILAQGGSIPADAAAVILNSPRKPLLPEEKQMLMQYGDGGGRLLITYDPQVTVGDVSDIAAHFGAVIGKDVIVDMVQRLFAGPALGVQPILQLNGSHKILERFSEGDVAIFNLSSSVRVDDAGEEAKKNCKDLLMTGKNSWAETNLAALFDSESPNASRDPEDTPGPVSVAVVCEKIISKAQTDSEAANYDKASRVIVVGDSDWFANGNIMNYSARDLVLNMVNWLAGEEGGISIRAKQMRASAAPIERSQFAWIFICSYLVPEIILLLGLYVWWKRKSRA